MVDISPAYIPDFLPGQYTAATLPTPSNNVDRLAWVTDMPGFGVMVCDGAQWQALSFSLGLPNARGALTLGVAYQATNPAKAAVVTANLTSTSSNSLLAATQASQKGEVIIGPTAASVTGATGNKVGQYESTQGGVLVVGLTITQVIGSTVTFALPIGWYFGVRQTVGANLTVPSVFDQSIS